MIKYFDSLFETSEFNIEDVIDWGDPSIGWGRNPFESAP